ncbi:MAG: malate/lactate/ureidoglycolate dehydrogenase [Alphaproteobacteria bacterium]|nr:malate/lactate/ureidoglycolate dehydrogenase [Alphaproteobacteria bacterium]
MTRRIEAPALTEFVTALFRAVGCAGAEAATIAHHLVAANLMGHDSHGVGLVTEYVRSIRAGRFQVGRHARVVTDRGPILVIDGQRGAGQIIGTEAMDLAIARARAHGVAVVALRQSHHLGRIGAYAEQCAEAGLVSLHAVNVIGHRPLVAPFGGRDVRLGTNPFCAGVPCPGQPPLILDMATSCIAYGKLRVAFYEGRRVEPGVLIDRDGRPTDDPAVMVPDAIGALLPFGGHKGYGLGLLCDILAGALSEGGTNHAGAFDDDMIINNMLSIVLDPAALGDSTAIADHVERVIDWVKASPLAPGSKAVLIAGEPERARRAERLAHGIPIAERTLDELAEVARSLGVATPF